MPFVNLSPATTTRLPASVRAHCTTADGEAFLQKLLHPPSDSAPRGIPDGSEGQSAVVDQRSEFTVSFSGIEVDPTVKAGANFDALIWTPPGNNMMALIAVGISPVDFRTATLNDGTAKMKPGEVVVKARYYEDTTLDTDINCHACCDSFGVPAPPPSVDALSAFAMGKSVGVPQPGAAAPPELPSTRYFASTINRSEFQRYRTLASSITCYYTAPATESQGAWHVWNGGSRAAASRPVETNRQIQSVPDTVQPPLTGTVTGGKMYAGGTIFEAVHPTMFSVPFDEADAAALQKEPYINRAPLGFYSIHRPTTSNYTEWVEREPVGVAVDIIDPLTTATFPWARFGVTTFTGSVANEAGVTGPTFRSYDTATLSCVPLNSVRAPASRKDVGVEFNTTARVAVPWLAQYFTSGFIANDLATVTNTDLAFSPDWTHTVAIGRALSFEGSFTLKRCLCLEVNLTPRSPLRSMLTRPPLLDAMAMRTALLLARASETTFKASDNNWAAILKDLAKAAKVVLPIVGGAIAGWQPELAPLIASGVAGAEAALTTAEGVGQAIVDRRGAGGPGPRRTRQVANRPKPALQLPARSKGAKSKKVAQRRKRGTMRNGILVVTE